MNKLNKLFLGIIIILLIALCTITVMYLKERDFVYEYLGNYNFSLYGDEYNNNINSLEK